MTKKISDLKSDNRIGKLSYQDMECPKLTQTFTSLTRDANSLPTIIPGGFGEWQFVIPRGLEKLNPVPRVLHSGFGGISGSILFQI